jgi:hypothetical protein
MLATINRHVIGYNSRTYHIGSVILLNLLDVVVNQGLGIPSFDLELPSTVSQARNWQNDILDECQYTVALYFLRNTFGLADLLGHNLGGVQKVNLAIYG